MTHTWSPYSATLRPGQVKNIHFGSMFMVSDCSGKINYLNWSSKCIGSHSPSSPRGMRSPRESQIGSAGSKIENARSVKCKPLITEIVPNGHGHMESSQNTGKFKDASYRLFLHGM